MSMPERVWIETGTILEAIGLSIMGTRLKDGPFPGSVEYVRADALPTKAQIDRLVEAMPDETASSDGPRLTSIDSTPLYRDDIRVALYHAAGVEVEG